MMDSIRVGRNKADAFSMAVPIDLPWRIPCPGQ